MGLGNNPGSREQHLAMAQAYWAAPAPRLIAAASHTTVSASDTVSIPDTVSASDRSSHRELDATFVLGHIGLLCRLLIRELTAGLVEPMQGYYAALSAAEDASLGRGRGRGQGRAVGGGARGTVEEHDANGRVSESALRVLGGAAPRCDAPTVARVARRSRGCWIEAKCELVISSGNKGSSKRSTDKGRIRGRQANQGRRGGEGRNRGRGRCKGRGRGRSRGQGCYLDDQCADDDRKRSDSESDGGASDHMVKEGIERWFLKLPPGSGRSSSGSHFGASA